MKTLCLYFYRIGGREVYHQSRVKSGRHKHASKQRHSGEFSHNQTSITSQGGLPGENYVESRKSSGSQYETHFFDQVKFLPKNSYNLKTVFELKQKRCCLGFL